MNGSILSLLPATIAIFMALLTKEVYTSLFCGILVGAFLIADFNPLSAFNIIVVDGLSKSVSDLAGNFCFLVILGSFMVMLNKAGGVRAFGIWIGRNIKSRFGGEISVYFMGVLVFIDDYFNCLTVGNVMRTLTDKLKISRAKLAYLVDSTAAPICIIAPISSWAAAVTAIASDMGTGLTGIQLFIQAIPYNFYSLLTLIFIPLLCFLKFDYGKMRVSQQKALQGDLETCEKTSPVSNSKPQASALDFILPILLLIAFVTSAMLYVGGYFGENSWQGAKNIGDLSGALGDTDTFIALPLGSFITFLIVCIWFLIKKKTAYKEIAECITNGFSAMIPGILLLTLATTLKTETSALGTAEFVQSVMLGSSASLYNMLPCVIFAVSIALAFATGTSYGTFGVMIPIIIAVFPTDSPLLIIGISACLAGAVCGDHCSPISDTTVMSAMGAGVDHLEHVETQLPYVMTVAAISFVTYIVAGFTQNWTVSIVTGIILTVTTLLVIKKFTMNNHIPTN